MNDSMFEERLVQLIEEKEWKKAEDNVNNILDVQPNNAKFFLYKLMIKKHVVNINQLKTLKKPLDDDINYKRILQYGDSDLINELNKINNDIKEKISRKMVLIKKYMKPFVALSIIIAIVCCSIVFYFVPKKNYDTAVELYDRYKKYKESSDNHSSYYISTLYEAYDNFVALGNFLDSKKIAKEIKQKIDERNYVSYGDVTIKLPASTKYTSRMENDAIVINGDFSMSINSFLKYINPPDGYYFYSIPTAVYSPMGGKSWVVKDYARNWDYKYNNNYYNGNLDLIFYDVGEWCEAKYITRNGIVPDLFESQVAKVTLTTYNTWKANVQFRPFEEFTIIGQCKKSSETKQIEIKVIIK